MKHLVVKVKDRDLFFNADEMMGEYVSKTPMLLDKQQVDSIMKYCIDIHNFDTDELFTNDDLEVREVELKLL
jgi:hypothetical protein